MGLISAPYLISVPKLNSIAGYHYATTDPVWIPSCNPLALPYLSVFSLTHKWFTEGHQTVGLPLKSYHWEFASVILKMCFIGLHLPAQSPELRGKGLSYFYEFLDLAELLHRVHFLSWDTDLWVKCVLWLWSDGELSSDLLEVICSSRRIRLHDILLTSVGASHDLSSGKNSRVQWWLRLMCCVLSPLAENKGPGKYAISLHTDFSIINTLEGSIEKQKSETGVIQ